MKRLAIILISALLAVPAFAQDSTSAQTTTVDQNGQTTTNKTYDDDSPREHVTLGAFLDVLRLQHASTNKFGFGGRLGLEMGRWGGLEFEGAYDFRQNVATSVTQSNVTTTYNAGLRTTTFLAGPIIHTRGPVRIFGTVKGGLLNFSVNTDTNAPAAFVNTLGNIRSGDTNGALYPAAGIELGGRHFALRGEVGDLIYFDRGANHNFRFTVGPTIRF